MQTPPRSGASSDAYGAGGGASGVSSMTASERRRRMMEQQRERYMPRAGFTTTMVSSTPMHADLGRPSTPPSLSGSRTLSGQLSNALSSQSQQRSGANSATSPLGSATSGSKAPHSALDDGDVEEVDATPSAVQAAMNAFSEPVAAGQLGASSAGSSGAASQAQQQPAGLSGGAFMSEHASTGGVPPSASAGASASAASASSSAAASSSGASAVAAPAGRTGLDVPPPPVGPAAQSHSSAEDTGFGRPLALTPAMLQDKAAMRHFLTSPVPKGCVVQLNIRRDRSGIRKLFPEYTVILKDSTSYVMTARKRKKNKTTTYAITMDDRDLTRKSPHYLGKLASNFLGTEFTAYDNGTSFDRKKPAGAQAQETNVLGSKGPRVMRVALPAMTESGKAIEVRPQAADETLSARYRKQQLDEMVVLHNKPPEWNAQTSSYVLNFRGRVTVASIKNFQLVLPSHASYIVVQAGKCGDDLFAMDVQYPMSPLQAFCITLSSFDNKLGLE